MADAELKLSDGLVKPADPPRVLTLLRGGWKSLGRCGRYLTFPVARWAPLNKFPTCSLAFGHGAVKLPWPIDLMEPGVVRTALVLGALLPFLRNAFCRISCRRVVALRSDHIVHLALGSKQAPAKNVTRAPDSPQRHPRQRQPPMGKGNKRFSLDDRAGTSSLFRVIQLFVAVRQAEPEAKPSEQRCVRPTSAIHLFGFQRRVPVPRSPTECHRRKRPWWFGGKPLLSREAFRFGEPSRQAPASSANALPRRLCL